MAKDRTKKEETESKLKRKEYENKLRKLQAELCKLQDWVKEEGLRVIVVFEGRDAAGKGGMIRAIMERVSPRVFSRRAAGSLGPGEDPDVHAAVHGRIFPQPARS